MFIAIYFFGAAGFSCFFFFFLSLSLPFPCSLLAMFSSFPKTNCVDFWLNFLVFTYDRVKAKTQLSSDNINYITGKQMGYFSNSTIPSIKILSTDCTDLADFSL